MFIQSSRDRIDWVLRWIEDNRSKSLKVSHSNMVYRKEPGLQVGFTWSTTKMMKSPQIGREFMLIRSLARLKNSYANTKKG